MKKIILSIIILPFLFLLSSCYTVLLSPNKEKEFDESDTYYNYYDYSDYDYYYFYPWWLERRNFIYDDDVSAPTRTPDNGELRRDNSNRNTQDRDLLKNLPPPTRQPGDNNSGNNNDDGSDNSNQNDSSKKRTESTTQSDNNNKSDNNNSNNLRNSNSSRSTDKGRR